MIERNMIRTGTAINKKTKEKVEVLNLDVKTQIDGIELKGVLYQSESTGLMEYRTNFDFRMNFEQGE